jgi:hypothetical protein
VCGWVNVMVYKAKDLSPEQKLVVEKLVGRPLAEYETISVRAIAPEAAPDWLQKSWDSAGRLGLQQLSMAEIDEEIAVARKARRSHQQPVEQRSGLFSTRTS